MYYQKRISVHLKNSTCLLKISALLNISWEFLGIWKHQFSVLFFQS